MKKISRREERYRSILDNMPVMIFTTDLKGNISYSNHVASDLTGFSSEKLLTMNIYDLIAAEFHSLIKEELDNKDHQKKVMPYEVEAITEEGERLIIELHSSPLVDFTDEVTGIQHAARNITKEKTLEKQLVHTQKMKAIGTLAGGIAHDFNNLLTVVIGNAQMAKMVLPADSKAIRKIENIEEAGSRGKELVKQLLQYGRPGKTKSESLDVNKMVEETFHFLGALIPSTIKIEKNLIDMELIIDANPSLVTQILTNLSVNARDAMPQGGILRFSTGRVKIDEEYCEDHIEASPGEFCVVKVSDSGKGMHPQVIERIFEPFYTTKQRSSSAGLGLAIVYSVVKRMGGWLEVKSEIGLGTQFIIYLPLSKQRQVVAREESIELPGGSETILFADDEELILEMAEGLLETMGYKSMLAKDTDEAISIFKENSATIDMAIVDVTMPGGGGTKVMEVIQSIDPTLPIILASGYTEKSGETVAKATAFIQKPYLPHDLAKLMRKHLDISKKRREKKIGKT